MSNSVFTPTGIPGWLLPPQQVTDPATFDEEIIERVLTGVAGGITILRQCREDPSLPRPGVIRKAILSDPDYTQRFEDAMKLGALHLVDKMEDVAIGVDTEDSENPALWEAQRAKLVCETLRWKAEKMDPDRFGPKTKVEHTHDIDIKMAIEAGNQRAEQNRMITINKEPVRIGE